MDDSAYENFNGVEALNESDEAKSENENNQAKSVNGSNEAKSVNESDEVKSDNESYGVKLEKESNEIKSDNENDKGELESCDDKTKTNQYNEKSTYELNEQNEVDSYCENSNDASNELNSSQIPCNFIFNECLLSAPTFHPYYFMKDHILQYLEPIIKKAKKKNYMCCC
ncbi:hypothetical protein, conserved [Plasmodium gonderi]|uniref:Uncharacterized protein n=1 Tax=Plasmodium gonderi TaxID=77519 RepID=A0A1Y1JQQ3_PLAGO|nr:hypothetical protein, conserved [Plasmodium gonderi]GAW83172.1 hypothetical protein, conserved [Plasmodium gonderi]